MSPPPPWLPLVRRPPPPPPLGALPPAPLPHRAPGAVKERSGARGDRRGPAGRRSARLPPPTRPARPLALILPRAQARTGGRWRRAAGRAEDAEPGRGVSQAAARAWTRRVPGGRPSAVPHGAPPSLRLGAEPRALQLPPPPRAARTPSGLSTPQATGSRQFPPLSAFLGRPADRRRAVSESSGKAETLGVFQGAADPGMEGRRGGAARGP